MAALSNAQQTVGTSVGILCIAESMGKLEKIELQYGLHRLPIPREHKPISGLEMVYWNRSDWAPVNGVLRDIGMTMNCRNQERKMIMHLGAITELNTFYQHESIRDIRFQFDERRQEIIMKDRSTDWIISNDNLDSYFIRDLAENVVIPLRTPIICRNNVRRNRTPGRSAPAMTIPKSLLADTSAIYIQNGPVTELFRFLTNNLNKKCFYGSETITLIDKSQMAEDQYELNGFDFISNYGWKMVLSLGFRIKDRLNDFLFMKIKDLANRSRSGRYFDHTFYRKMLAIFNVGKNNRFFKIDLMFDQISPAWLPPMRNGYVYTPRVYLTPYGQYPRPIKASCSNRVTRHRGFGDPTLNYCRVLLRNIDFQSLRSSVIDEWRPDLERILVKDGLMIGNRPFHLLWFSNSQLRDCSMYFYRQFNKITAADIRRWLGDFRHEKSVGTKVARLAQCFTATSKGIELSENQLICIPDKFDTKGRCFTDGCGKISISLMKKLFQNVNVDNERTTQLPSVIQIRCGGLKGLLALDLDLSGDVIEYRPSQKKFISNHLELELIKYSQPSPLALNQQLVTLLENMGIPQSIFIALKNKYQRKLSLALISPIKAWKLLKRFIRYWDWKSISESGINITREPFIRSLLLNIVHHQLKGICEKTRIPLSMKSGRMLFGVVDEKNCLNEGEVFIKISQEPFDETVGTPVVIAGCQVLVTRMPCHHPGDVRLLKAVDRPELHHLVDCIVFPAKGSRPHPTEMSGGDLDGDEYWTCWDENLTENITQMYFPGEYESPQKPVEEQEIDLPMMVRFIVNILRNIDKIGVLSKRHLAICAKDSPKNPTALALTKHINEALDFPKTGVLTLTDKQYRNLNVLDYPDFLQNKHKNNFHCDKVLGVLFRQVMEVFQPHQEICQKPTLSIMDQELLVEGFKTLLNIAKMDYENYCHRLDGILKVYDISTESELITGCYFHQAEEKQSFDDQESAKADYFSLRRETVAEFEKRIANRPVEYRQRLISAYYFVTYHAEKSTKPMPRYLSFPWIFYQDLCEIKKMKNQVINIEKSQFEKIGLDLIHRFRMQAKEPLLPFVKVIRILDNQFRTLNGDFSSSIKIVEELYNSHELFINTKLDHQLNPSRLGEQFVCLLSELADNTLIELLLILLHTIAISP